MFQQRSQECKAPREAAGASLLKKQQRGPGVEVEWGGVRGRGQRPGQDHAWMTVGWEKGSVFFFCNVIGRFWRVMSGM